MPQTANRFKNGGQVARKKRSKKKPIRPGDRKLAQILSENRFRQVYYDSRQKRICTRRLRKMIKVKNGLYFFRYHLIAYDQKRKLWVVRDLSNDQSQEFFSGGTWHACRAWIKNELNERGNRWKKRAASFR
jgi:hypothetical protein